MLPLPGYPTSGAGLRAWGIGQGLRMHGFNVDFAIPAFSWRKDIPQQNFNFRLFRWDIDNQEHLIREENPDAVVFCHWPAMHIRKRLDIPTIIDFHGPHILERAFQGVGEYGSNALEKIDAIRKADYFICAGERQKAYFLSWLLISGFDITTDCISSVPVGLPPDLPERSPSEIEPTFVYGGVYLPWQDPRMGLTAVAEMLARHNRGVLRLFGGQHPSIPIAIPPLFQELEKKFKDHPQVRFEGFKPHDELIDIYRSATVAIDLMAANYERELAFTTRTVEYLWCGLPVIYNNYAELSELIREYKAGWTIDPHDREGLEQIINAIITNPTMLKELGRNAQRLIRERLTWDITTTPLAIYLKNGKKSQPLHEDLASLVARKVGKRDFWTGFRPVVWRSPKSLLARAKYHYNRGGILELLNQIKYFVRHRLPR